MPDDYYLSGSDCPFRLDELTNRRNANEHRGDDLRAVASKCSTSVACWPPLKALGRRSQTSTCRVSTDPSPPVTLDTRTSAAMFGYATGLMPDGRHQSRDTVSIEVVMPGVSTICVGSACFPEADSRKWTGGGRLHGGVNGDGSPRSHCGGIRAFQTIWPCCFPGATWGTIGQS